MSQSFHRGRRLRWTPEIRSMVRETPPLLAEDLIMPYFVVETEDQSFRKEIGAMPGQYQHAADRASAPPVRRGRAMAACSPLHRPLRHSPRRG